MGYNQEIVEARERRDQLIVSLLLAGKTQHEIAAEAQCGISTVNNVKIKYRVSGKGRGRPRKEGRDTKAGVTTNG